MSNSLGYELKRAEAKGYDDAVLNMVHEQTILERKIVESEISRLNATRAALTIELIAYEDEQASRK